MEYVSQRSDVKISLLHVNCYFTISTKSTMLAASSSIRSESISRKLTRFSITHRLSLVATVHGCGGGGGVRSLSVRIVGLNETGPRHPVEAERGKEESCELRTLSLMHAFYVRSYLIANAFECVLTSRGRGRTRHHSRRASDPGRDACRSWC